MLKEDLIENLEGMWATVNVLLKNFLKIDMGDELNLNLLMDAVSIFYYVTGFFNFYLRRPTGIFKMHYLQ